jgi:hydrogenase-1 operon protein HyaF
MANFHLPPVGFGPGSQGTGEELDFMPLPSGMRTYAPHVPEVEPGAAPQTALTLLDDIAAACDLTAIDGQSRSVDVSGLDATARALLAETLGQGEVAMKLRGVPAVAVQESVFAGVWVLKGEGVDRVEIAPYPTLAFTRAHVPHRPALGAAAFRGAQVVNAPALLVELEDRSRAWELGAEVHVINLSLLPHTEEDLIWLAEATGEGAVTVLSRGYGNCRVTATALAHVWRVQFYNSTDALILDTYEVTEMPEVVIAAPEDLADSAERIREVLEAIR